MAPESNFVVVVWAPGIPLAPFIITYILAWVIVDLSGPIVFRLDLDGAFAFLPPRPFWMQKLFSVTQTYCVCGAVFVARGDC